MLVLRSEYISERDVPVLPRVTVTELQNRRSTDKNQRQPSTSTLLKLPTYPPNSLSKMVHRVTVKVNNSTPFTLQPNGQYAHWGETKSGPDRVR